MPVEVAEIRWRPFYLDPTLPKEGVDRMRLYRAKFGEARMQQMIPYMKAVGLKESPPINFDYSKGVVANTTDSHRLAEWAYMKGGATMQERLMEEMFHDYFEDGLSLGSHANLSKAASRAGLSEAEALAFLGTDALRSEVEKDVRAYAAKYRVSGVPFFVINGKHTVSGAQEADAFLEIFQEISDE